MLRSSHINFHSHIQKTNEYALKLQSQYENSLFIKTNFFLSYNNNNKK